MDLVLNAIISVLVVIMEEIVLPVLLILTDYLPLNVNVKMDTMITIKPFVLNVIINAPPVKTVTDVRFVKKEE